jgi:uncharacterized membrane protein YbhN (UPF0104 family)
MPPAKHRHPPKGRGRLVRLLGSILGLGLFIAALWVLRHELQQVTLQDVVHELRSIPQLRLGGTLLLTGLGYLALTGYDLLGLRYLGLALPRRRVFFASFVGYALANNIPLAFLVGGSVRYRLYSGWGVSGADTASLVLFNILTYSLGLATAAALVFTLHPDAIPSLLRLPFPSTRPLGLAAAALVIGYLGWSARGRRLGAGKWAFAPPPLSISIQQIAVSLADWLLSGAALFILLSPSHPLSYPAFFGVFILGQIAALIAQLPGGLGVFEAVMLASLSSTIPPAAVLGALVAYRIIYFLLPLALAAILLGTREIARVLSGRR